MRKLWVVCLISLAISAPHPACTPDTPKPEEIWKAGVVMAWVSHHSGVYHTNATGEDYRASLASFLQTHPELDCRYFGADDGWRDSGSGPRLRITGHTIVCRDTSIDAQNEPVRE